MSESQTVTVSILDKEYQISCAADEVDDLLQSARYVDEKMREIKSGSGVFGLDRLAVMAALNIANDYLGQTRKTDHVVASRNSELETLNGKIDQALNRLRKAT